MDRPTRDPAPVGRESIRRFTIALADLAHDADLETQVPTCPDWSLGDLVWHLTKVQDFWTHVIINRPGSPESHQHSPRPSDNQLVANLRNATLGLDAALESCAADEPAWSWAAEQTVGFTLRRQTHEALVHCVDGFLAVGEPLPDVSPELAADGIDEIVTVMLEPTEDADVDTVTLHATDTGDRWTITAGHGDATIAGSAVDLYLWLWGRCRSGQLEISGAVEEAAALRSRLAGDLL